MSTTGRNITFPIYNEDGTLFNGLVLKKSTYDSQVMSLGDKITGDVYYKNNTLSVTMREYIVYNGVKFVLVNPPTIVREGLARDNGDMKGMTKYSFAFYHPMYMLGNFPFSDVAVSNDEFRYLSQNKTFSWIGKPDDYINKLNKNLENTEWVVVKSPRFPVEKEDQLSEVLSFDNATIAEALKKGYDTWGVPYIVDEIKEGDRYYDIGKRFVVVLGLPSNEITVNGEQFIFRFGKGVGLQNNSRTPRNNKIITRLAGYGSEDNIPYGYPQIRWYGNPDWEYTEYNMSSHISPNLKSYKLYWGIVGGEYVKLIQHPFTRTHLMPSIYRQTLFNKISRYLSDGSINPDYDPNIEIVDYYDAISDDTYTYQNEINPLSPSFEVHEFEDIKPEMDDGRSVVTIGADAIPIKNDLTDETIWDDNMDSDGSYVQSYFKIVLPVLSFDIYACAAITQEMQINMRSGACIGCTFPVQVDWDAYKSSFYDTEGNFSPYGEQRDYQKFPDSRNSGITLVLQKEYSTFGTIMPNSYQQPKDGDEIVVLGISLPDSYISSAEERLDDAMKAYMLENNSHYYDYPLKFDEYFLATHTDILSQIKPNTIIRFVFGEELLELYVKQLTVKFGDGVLPKYDITLTDNIEVTLNQIGAVTESVENLGALVSALRQTYGKNVWVELAKKLSKTNDDVAQGKITFNSGFQSNDDGTFGKWQQDVGGAAIYNDGNSWHIEADYLHARKKLVAKELQIEEVTHVGGQQLLSAAEMVCDYVVEHDTFYRCYFLKVGENGRVIHNKWKAGDQARMQSFNVDQWESGQLDNRYYWRLVIGTSKDTQEDIADYNQDFSIDFFRGVYLPDNVSVADYHFIDLSKSDCDTDSDVPMTGDKIIQLGYRYDDDPSRQNAIMLAGAGTASPYIDEYVGINSYTLEGKCMTRIKPNENMFTGKVHIEGGSTIDGKDLEQFIADIEDSDMNIQNLNTGNENLLRNTGFTGDYEYEDVEEGTEMNPDTQNYSAPLKYWNYLDTTVRADINSASGFSAQIGDGYIQQETTKELNAGDDYNVSFRASGTFLSVSVGTFSKQIVLTNALKRYTLRFTNTTNGKQTFSVIGTNARIMEIQLSCGNVANTDWIPSPLDNTSAIAYFQNLAYLANAINNASTEILGGLILSQMIRVGNYRNRKMVQETGGMSGIYASNNSPFLWGGGTMEDAIYTVLKYANNPEYQPTDEELSKMAKFVVTHGGRAILNDIVLRGYIYALGGYFKGEVHAEGGVFKSVTSPNGNFSIDADGNFECTDARIRGQLYTPMFIVNESNWAHSIILQPENNNNILNLGYTGLNVQIDYTPYEINILLPLDNAALNGAQIYIINNSQNTINIATRHVMVGGLLALAPSKMIVLYCYKDGNYYEWINV